MWFIASYTKTLGSSAANSDTRTSSACASHEDSFILPETAEETSLIRYTIQWASTNWPLFGPLITVLFWASLCLPVPCLLFRIPSQLMMLMSICSQHAWHFMWLSGLTYQELYLVPWHSSQNHVLSKFFPLHMHCLFLWALKQWISPLGLSP